LAGTPDTGQAEREQLFIHLNEFIVPPSLKCFRQTFPLQDFYPLVGHGWCSISGVERISLPIAAPGASSSTRPTVEQSAAVESQFRSAEIAAFYGKS
jgi:hypothetical protein